MHALPALPTDPTELQEAYAYPAEGVWLRANMIASLDGAAWYADRTEALGSPGDRRLFLALRGLADVVIVGAETVRVEGYGPVKASQGWDVYRAGRTPVPPLAVISRRLDLDLDAPFFTRAREGARTILLTTETAPPDRRAAAERVADVIVAGRDGLDFPRAVEELAARGLRRLLCEGGPTILARAAAEHVLDELCLTLSPTLVAGDPARILNGPQLPEPSRLRLASLYEEDDFLFLRYARR
ncbi:pyrimidine reductase family protein [Thermomonospora cellulosilytica]|uniref:Riboflavin biosynthesis pyrimidine reductase n=1 Tax=Thermomonospora cellulosilytica TaxID=1411118 RepID=A0A7W3MZ89_9ACTN|nr:pyrimidine reductase family protein [Thermomonospora cellulosilytica]MBA9004630.1 riboflavin biosynthesis pyrimidine reductase [Thermomonospora cellulosilytica]